MDNKVRRSKYPAMRWDDAGDGARLPETFRQGRHGRTGRRDRITQSVAEEVAQMRKDFSRQAPDAPAA